MCFPPLFFFILLVRIFRGHCALNVNFSVTFGFFLYFAFSSSVLVYLVFLTQLFRNLRSSFLGVEKTIDRIDIFTSAFRLLILFLFLKTARLELGDQLMFSSTTRYSPTAVHVEEIPRFFSHNTYTTIVLS